MRVDVGVGGEFNERNGKMTNKIKTHPPNNENYNLRITKPIITLLF